MKNTVTISCVIGTTNPDVPLGFEVWINDKKFFDTDHVIDTKTVLLEITDDDGDHELRFVLKNKQSDHTQVDSDGNIVADACLTMSDIAFDGIMLGHMFTKLAKYTHNFNGSGDTTQNQFHGQMGCNGTVSLEFTTPVYLWLLENM
jgi:hypothetical protein